MSNQNSKKLIPNPQPTSISTPSTISHNLLKLLMLYSKINVLFLLKKGDIMSLQISSHGSNGVLFI